MVLQINKKAKMYGRRFCSRLLRKEVEAFHISFRGNILAPNQIHKPFLNSKLKCEYFLNGRLFLIA